MSYLGSTKPLRAMGVVKNAETAAAIAEALDGERGLDGRVEVGRLEELSARAAELARADVLILDCDLDRAEDIEALRHLIEGPLAGTAIVVTSRSTSLDAVRALMRLGIADFVPQPVRRKDLVTAIREAGTRRPAHGGTGDDGNGLIIPVLNSCGGGGATTVAVNLACAYARRHHVRSLLLDLDVQFGNAGLYLDVEPRMTSLDVLQAGQRLDVDLLGSAVTVHRTGLDLLPAPTSVMPLESVTTEMAKRLMACSAVAYHTVIVDLPRAWTAWTRTVLAAADTIVLVMQMTVPAVHQAARQIGTLIDEGLGDIPLVIVVNRHANGLFGKDEMVRQAERLLGLELEHFIPSDYKAVSHAINAGMPLSDVDGGRKTQRCIESFADVVLKTAAARQKARRVAS